MSVFRRAAQRRGTPADALVVGLANPGSEYRGSRHNVGSEVIELLAERHGVSMKLERRERASVGVAHIDGRAIAIAVPTTYMNASGESVAPLIRRFGIVDPAQLIVVHDELDLEPGRIKVKVGGGAAGNNGVRSIISHLGTKDFARVRVGVGKPPHPRAGKDWVLKRPSKADRELLDQSVDRAASCVESMIREGTEAAMNQFNSSR